MPEPIGEIPVIITGDYSQLQNDLNQSIIAAELGAQKIAGAFTTAAGGTDQWTEALGRTTVATQAEIEAIGQAADATAKYGGAVEGILGAEAHQLDVLQLIPKSYTEMTAAQQRAVDKLNEQTQASEAARDSLSKLTDGTISWGSALKLLGIDITARAIKDLATDALEAFAAVEKATVSITALTGSAEQAGKIINDLKGLALQDALSFPSLLVAEQRMLAFGFATDRIPGALRTIADTAAATGKSFDQLGNTFERIVETGNAQGRSLLQLGINVRDIAKAMDVTEASARQMFAALDEEDRITVLQIALGKFNGVAGEVAKSLSGQWQNLSTEFTLSLQKMGEALGPFASALISAAHTVIIPALDATIAKVKELSDTLVGMGSIAAELGAPLAKLTNDIFGIHTTMADLIKGPLADWLTLPISAPTKLWGALVDTIHAFTNTGPEIDAMTKSVADSLNRLNKATVDANGGFQAWLASTHQLSPALAAVADAQEKANEKAITARQAWQGLIEQQKQGVVGQDAVNRAYKEYESALLAANNGIDSQKIKLKELEQGYKDFDKGLGAAGATMQDTFLKADAAAKGLSVTILGTFKEQGQAFAEWAIAAAKAADSAGPPFEIFARKLTDIKPGLVDLQAELGHFPSMTEQIAAGFTVLSGRVDQTRDAFGFLKGSGTDALQALIDGGKNSVQIVTDFNDVVSQSGSIISSMGATAVSVFGNMDAAIKQMNSDFKDWASGVGSFGSNLGILDPTQGGGKGKRGGPGSTNAQGDFNTGFSLPPHTHLDYSLWGITGARVVPDDGWYYDQSGNLVQFDPETIAKQPKAANSPASATVAAQVQAQTSVAPLASPDRQYFLDQGISPDQIASLTTATTQLTDTLGTTNTTFASLSPMVQTATTQLTEVVAKQSASFQNLTQSLAPISAPAPVSTGTPASFQRTNTINTTSSSAQVNNVQITTTPQMDQLINEIVVELQRRGIRM